MPQIVFPKGKDSATDTPFDPCAATAAHFLFTQGSTILVLHHDTLSLERRFQSHTEAISLISVDNVSERGQGRLVVTYDVGKTAIIWDLFTGEQISRFASYEPLLVAAWMRNGNIAFGNEKGDVILFEPATSEHISARTIHDPITALAPSSDCKTYAIGYRNGSILLAALQPQFTILHTLNTSRAPSPIAMLTWHASSSKQKSDMLAIQTADGDLRVWSVPKPPTAGQPRVIRVLRRDDDFVHGRNWISWSRNGRIIQFSEGETWAWDVRTKDVNYAPVPTIEYVQGIAAHGPTAALFTLGPENTIQQYDIDNGQMVANVRHTPVTIPPTPPEEHVRQFNSAYDDNAASPVKSNRYEADHYRKAETPASPHSHSQSTGSKKSVDKKYSLNDVISPAKTERTATTFSSLGAYTYGQTQPQSAHPVSPVSSKPTNAVIRKGSRLRQEVVLSPMTPDDALIIDLFPFTRTRLSEVQQHPRMLNESNMTSDELRKHMLAMVFGWEDDIYAMIEEEYLAHPRESLGHLFLSKWLENGSESVIEIMGNTPADPIVDWIRLALATLDNRPENKKIGQIFAEKMLSKGEIHMAAVAYLAMGDKNDAIEVYVSNNCYMEAILLTCLIMPQDWQRQSALVRKWGEHVVENSQQNLAIRCFACIGVEPTEAWFSPTAQIYSKLTSPRSAVLYPPPVLGQSAPQQQQQSQAVPQLQIQTQQPPQHPPHQYQPQQVQQLQTLQNLNPHLARVKGRGFEAPTPVALIAPPTPFRAAAAKGARITPQTGGLKLITSFGQKANMFKFPGLKTDDMTPINATNITPIAESAIDRSALSPGGLGSYRMNNIQSLNSAISATTALARSRLPSIGETAETSTPTFPKRGVPRAPPTPADSGSDKEKEKQLAAKKEAEKQEKQEPSLTVLSSARYVPTSTPTQSYGAELEPQTALRPTTGAAWHSSLNRVQEDNSHSRNGSRSRKPDGLALHLGDADPVQRPGTTDSTTTNFGLSPPVSGNSFRVKSPSVSGRSTDQYISSLDQAHFYRTRSRNSSRNPKEDRAERKKSKHRKHKNSEDIAERGGLPSGKRSPSSPIPMSPEELHGFGQSVESLDSLYYSQAAPTDDRAPVRHARRGSTSTTGTGRVRPRSRSAQPKRKMSSRGRAAEETDLNRRGRSKSRKEGSSARSPSSPLPMLPSEDDLTAGSGNDPAFKFVSQNRSRLHRSTSRRPERGTSSRRDASPDRRRGRPRSPSRQREFEDKQSRKRDTSEHAYAGERSHQDDLDQLDNLAESIKNSVPRGLAKSKTKELAQAELEARRLSLARRPSAPAIPVPGYNGFHAKSASETLRPSPPPLTRNLTDTILRPTQYLPARQDLARGRPGTPQAMAAPLDQPDETVAQRLGSDTYQLPARTYSANAMREDTEKWLPTEVPQTMPRHHAFDHRVSNSRGNSRSRTRADSIDRKRGVSTDRHEILPEEDDYEDEIPDSVIFGIGSPDPNGKRVSSGIIIPELQHLAVPPPPPPPPAPPKDLRIMTDLSNIASIPLPRSAYPGDREPQSATPENRSHKRGSSRTESGQLLGKIRGMADRMRSTSKPRDNLSRSPNVDDGIMSPYETVTMIPPPLSAIAGRR